MLRFELLVLTRPFPDCPPPLSDKVTLLNCNTSEDDILLKRQLDDLVVDYPGRLDVFYTVTRPHPSWPHRRGRVTVDMLKAVMPPPGPGIVTALCGPPPFLDTVGGAKSDFEPGDVTEEELGRRKRCCWRSGGMLREAGYGDYYVFE